MLLAMGPVPATVPIDVTGRQRKRRLSTSTSLAIGLSVAVHIGIGAYLYLARFEFHPIQYQDTPHSFEILTLPRTPPPPPPPPPRPDRPVQHQEHPAVHHAAMPVDAPQIDRSPIQESHTQLAAGTGFTSLPSGPDEGGGSVMSPPEPPHTITQPNWLSRPSGEQMSALYPDRAVRMGVSGRAVIDCTVDAGGRLRNCAVANQTPADFGFGDAAVRLSRYFRMSPRTVDGQAVDGGEVRIPIQFSIPDR